MKNKLDIQSIRKKLRSAEAFLNKYKALMLFLVIACLYGFIALRITTLSNAEPSQTDIDKVNKTTKIKQIPDNTVQRLKSLEGTNERTQSIFNEARQNPFKE